MELIDPKQIALRFNECINNRDINGLANLMTDDHTFIDTAESVVSGKASCVDAWRGFFDQYPDYKNIFTTVTSKGDTVTMIGYSICSDERLEGEAIWTATISDGKMVEWRVYEDTPQNRQRLEIS